MNPPWPNRTTHAQRELEAIAKDRCAYDVDRVHAVAAIDDVGVLGEIAANSRGAVAAAAQCRMDELDD